jgi:predicted nucleotide-binding protein (sugar kinase/HSP70/actin superfamily)
MGVSLDLPRKLASLGELAMPMDFLDIGARVRGQDPSKLYWAYGQRILAAAEIIRDDPRLRAIYLSNFSCGPDSFIHRFFGEAMAGKPCLFLEIDEHSAPAGVITRLEAFLDSLASRDRLGGGETSQVPANAEPVFTFRTTRGGQQRTIYIPNMSDQAYALAAAFRWSGMKAQVMPPSDETSLELGRAHTSGKECLPCIITTGDMLREIRRPGFDPDKTAFFMPSGTGPCRFGMYNQLHRLVLRETGHADVPILSVNQGHGFYQDFARLSRDPTRIAWRGIVLADLLLRALHHVRPHEREAGVTQRVYQQCLDTLCQTIESGEDIFRCAAWTATRFAGIPVDRTRPRPLIGIVGEIYVRSHAFSNLDIVRDLERLGAEAHVAGFLEWIYYTNFIRKRRGKRLRRAKDWLSNLLKDVVQRRDEARLARPFVELMPGAVEPPTGKLLDFADPYLHNSFEGEAALSIGKAIDFCLHRAAGIVNLMPFTCMPGTIVSAILKRVRRDRGDIPVLSIAMDGQQSAAHTTRLEAFVHQARQFMLQSQGARH